MTKFVFLNIEYNNMSKKYRLIGIVSNPKGLDGSFILTDVPEDLNPPEPGTKVKIGYSEQFSEEFTLKKWRAKKNAVITLNEIKTPEQAYGLKDKAVFAGEEDLEYLNDDLFFTEELIGDEEADDDTFGGFLVIEEDSGRELGRIIEVMVLPANDVWIVNTSEGELPLPVIDEVIREIDEDKRKIYVRLIPGLMDLIQRKDEE